jgi:hypothetical protein
MVQWFVKSERFGNCPDLALGYFLDSFDCVDSDGVRFLAITRQE